jgi:hypothetical protein
VITAPTEGPELAQRVGDAETPAQGWASGAASPVSIPRGWPSATASFRAAAWLGALLSVAPYFWHLATGSKAYLVPLEDDHYYYTVVADRLVSLGRFTFDGTTFTNGFHPLWLIVIAALRAVFGRFGTPYWIAFAVLLFACVAATFELSARLLRSLGASPWIAAGIASAFALGNERLAATGMEGAVAVPLFLWLLVEVARGGAARPRQAAKLGFIASLVVLARIDLGIAVLLIVCGLVYLERPRLAAVAAFAAGGLLLPLYAAGNLHWFGELLPISAVAKQQLVRVVFHPRYLWACAFDTHYGIAAGPLLLAGAIAVALELRDRRLDLSSLAALVPIAFAGIFFFLNAFTGWIFFGWYSFPYAVALPASLFLVWRRWLKGRERTAFALTAILCVSSLAGAARSFYERGPRGTVRDNTMLAMSLALPGKLQGRSGTYAMGAIAAAVAQRLDQPVVQLEGLVADRRMLEHLRRQDPLPQVLAENRVDYLVVSFAGEAPPRRNGCYYIAQPYAMWATESKSMRGWLCATPIVDFVTEHGPHPWSFFPTLQTLVFDVRAARWEPG